VPSALFVKTVETFVVIGLPDVLSAILLNVKLKRKTVTTLWKKRYVFMTGFLRNLKHNVISFLGDKKFNFLTSSLSKRKVKYFALVVVL
jgi:serine kinase of HPr protein (carbohydrate metabolism regulator)